MKPFNLKEAINGKAFYLENGYRGVIKYCVDDFITQFEQPPNYPYVGYVLDDKGFLFTAHTAWNENGKSNEYQSFNATAMVDDTPPQDKEETMKPFDLEKALAGEPVKLRGGFKAIIYYRVPDEFSHYGGSTEPYPLMGLIFNKDGTIKLISANWKDCGSFTGRQGAFDIVGMWEEPKISIEDLPKPFKPKDGESYFYINGGSVDYEHEFWDTNNFDITAAERGNCFRTREDAQKWLDFMKGMLE